MKIAKEISIMLIVLVLAGTVLISARRLGAIERGYKELEDPIYLPSGRYLDLISLDFRGLLADLFWIKGAIYFGRKYRLKAREYPWLEHILELAVTLDPLYYDVYWYGSSLLPTVEGRIRLLKRGMEYFPDDWKLPEMLGYTYDYFLEDYLNAGKYYEIASRKPGHPPYVPSVAGRYYLAGGDVDAAIRVLQNFLDNTDREDLKIDFELRIEQLKMIKLMEIAVEIYKHKFGKSPDRLGDLVKAGLLPEIPEDPYGGKFFLIKETGRVRTTSDPILRWKRPDLIRKYASGSGS